MNVFNLTGEVALDGFMLPGYESNHPPYYIDMPFSSTSNMTVQSLTEVLLTCFHTMIEDRRFNAYDKQCYAIIGLNAPHLIVANLLTMLMEGFGVTPRIYTYDRLHGINPLGEILGFLKCKEVYDNIRCSDWKTKVNQKSDFINNKENN